MLKPIRPDTLADFAFVNEDAFTGPVRGVLLNCHGFTDQDRRERSSAFPRMLGEQGILYILPYYNPWAWVNDQCIAFCDECLDALYAKYSLKKDITPFMVAGGSMGGLTAIMYPVLGSYRARAAAADCPVCDLRTFIGETDFRRCSFYDAYFHKDLDTELTRHNPLERLRDFPDIPYMIVRGEADPAIDMATQYEVLLAAMKDHGIDVTFVSVPDMKHCELEHFPEHLKQYADFCFRALGAGPSNR